MTLETHPHICRIARAIDTLWRTWWKQCTAKETGQKIYAVLLVLPTLLFTVLYVVYAIIPTTIRDYTAKGPTKDEEVDG